MSLDLASVLAKGHRAAEHFGALEDKIQSWVNANFDHIVCKRNAQFTEHRLIYRCTKEPDVVGWSLMFGDCIITSGRP